MMEKKEEILISKTQHHFTIITEREREREKIKIERTKKSN